MLTHQLFELALNLQEPWYIKDISFSAEAKRLDIQLDFRAGATFHYESKDEGICGDFKAYDTVHKEWRHLNFFQHECYLHARVPRLDISDREKRLVTPPWSGIGNGFTLLFEALVLQLAMHMPVHKVAQLVKETDYRIWNMLEQYVNKALENADQVDLSAIGMDETAQRRGHDYITLFVDLIKKRTVFIAEGKGHETVTAFAENIRNHNGSAENITDVSCDMSPAFIKGVTKELPHAAITFDRFHVLKIINHAVDVVRKQEAQTEPALKGSKYLFLKNAENLTKTQQEQRERLSMSHMKLKSLKALHLRERFQAIYAAEHPSLFEALLKRWYFWATHSRLQPMIAAARTIKEHWAGVVRWKQSQIDNGLLEGLNSLIQAAKAKARGFKTFRYFRIVVFLITGKLNFAQFNSQYLPI